MRYLLGLLVILLPVSIAPGGELPKPLPNTYIHDFAGVLSQEAKQALQKQAQYLKDSLDTEIAAVTLDTLNGEEVFDYSLKLANQWGIGSKDNEVRGVMLLLVVKDRKVSIRTSRHIEGQLNDGITGAISREMGDYFKKGDFGGGLALGLTKISDRLTETRNDAQTVIANGKKSYWWLWLLLAAGVGIGGISLYVVRKRRQERARAEERRQQTERNRAAYFKTAPVAQTGRKKKEKKPKPKPEKPPTKHQLKAAKAKSQSSQSSASQSSSYDSSGSSSSTYDSSSSSSSSSSSYDNDYSSSPSYSPGDSGSSYSGGSDFGGGGSDSSW